MTPTGESWSLPLAAPDSGTTWNWLLIILAVLAGVALILYIVRR